MRSAKEVLIQSTISYLIVRLVSCCCFYSCIAQKLLQTDYFGAESRPLIAGQLIAASDTYVYVQSDFPFSTVIPILHNKPLLNLTGTRPVRSLTSVVYRDVL